MADSVSSSAPKRHQPKNLYFEVPHRIDTGASHTIGSLVSFSGGHRAEFINFLDPIDIRHRL